MFQSLYQPGIEINTTTRSPQVMNVPFGPDLTQEPRIYWFMRFTGSLERVKGAVHHGGSPGRLWSQTAEFKFLLAAL